MPSAPDIRVRPATLADARRLFAWRNDPLTREMSRTSDPVPWQAHEAWLTAVLRDSARHLFVGEQAEIAIGTVRFDMGQNVAEISLALAPEARGKGLAAPLIRAGVATFRAVRPIPIRAEIRPDNAASRRAFEAAGFAQSGSTGSILHYWLS